MPIENKVDQPTKRQYFENLDALRFLAFLFIFLGHGLKTDSEVVLQSGVYQNFEHWIKILGQTGFSFAFVLSGYINTWVILEEKKVYQVFTPWKYYVRRALRIWPLYFLVLLIGFVIIPIILNLAGVDYSEQGNPLYFILFIGNFYLIEHGWTHSPIISVLWSVSVEEQFYLFWPFALLLFWRFRALLLLVLAGLFIATTYVYYDTDVNLWFHSLFLLADIGAGALFAFISFQKNWGFEWLTNRPKWFNGLMYLIFASILFNYREIFDAGLWDGASMLVIEKLVITIFLSYFIFEQNFGRHSLIKFGRFKWVSYFGVISYGLFCFHEIGLISGHLILEKTALSGSPWAHIILKPFIAFLLVWPIAALSWNYFEKPFLKLKRHFYG
jgi:peptidoglycan/LPS O-acetylase OafA/YrhL